MIKNLSSLLPAYLHSDIIFSTFAIFISIISVNPAKAQLIDSGEILRAGADDANVLLKEYLKPFGGGFGADLNSGWFTSAKPLDKFGFELLATVSASLVPEKDRLFNVSALNLKTVNLLRGPNQTPTAFGENEIETSTLGTVVENEEIFSFVMPEGSGYHFVPAPMAQFSLGLPGNSQISIRYTPAITIDSDYTFKIFGIGGIIGLNSLFFNDQLPFDLSIQAGIMDLFADADYQVQPIEDPDVENSYPESHWEDQGIDFNSYSFTANILAGKHYSILSLYAGIGYQSASTKINTRGSYPVVVPKSGSVEPGEPLNEIQSIDEPINFTLKGVNNFHAVGGLRLKLAVFSISASYTLAEYPTLKAGLGIIVGSE